MQILKLLPLAFAAHLAAVPAVTAQVSDTPEIAAELVGLGRELSREMVGGTMALYGPLHVAADHAGLTRRPDFAYGADPLQRLDVYAPEGADGTAPIVVFVHGGGFVRGDKSAPDAVGVAPYMADHGFVGIAMNYRFAPAVTWPAGAQDVGAVIEWIKANPTLHGGDPSRIVVMGHSAGAMHVADYAFREELQVENDGVIGAILVSPPTVDLTARPIDPERDALYYGTDGDRAAQSVVTQMDGRIMPVMVAYAEFEPEVIMDQTWRMIDALTSRGGLPPLVSGVAGHNHISIIAHIGTGDGSLGPDLIEFLRGTALRK